MILNNFEKYIFKGSRVDGVKTLINFSQKNNFKIVLHEETQNNYEQIENIEIVKEFPPLLFSVDLDIKDLLSLESLESIKKLTLLDGHHRFEHLTIFSYDIEVPVVLISDNDVRVESYKSRLEVSENLLKDILIENEFELSINPDYYLCFQDRKYSSKKIISIYDLYDFKRDLLDLEIITPIQNNIIQNENTVLSFTPIKLSEFQKNNYLFPPKSTWISPRI
jgi:hypothetical protein